MRKIAFILLALALTAGITRAESRALVVSGDPGPDAASWARRFDDWRTRWQKVLVDTCGLKAQYVQTLRTPIGASTTAPANMPDLASRENILAACAKLVKESTPADQVILVFIGHGYKSQNEVAKFAAPGDHLSDADLALALKDLKAKQLVVFYMAGDAAAWAKTLAGPGHVIVIANTKKSAPMFCEFLLREFARGNPSVTDAFNRASLQDIRFYQNQFVQKEAATVHGKEFQEIFKHLYPEREMTVGDEVPRPANNDPSNYDAWLGRRVLAEVAGIEDDGDGEVSTVFQGKAEPTAVPNKESKDGEVAKKIILGFK